MTDRADASPKASGESDAFAELFREFADDVNRLCLRLLGSPGEAEDASQEAFLKARKALPEFDRSKPFRPWLLAIASHHCIDRLRRRSLERRIFAPDEIDPETLSSPAPSPLGGVLQTERRMQLLAAIGELSERYRAPLILRFYADLDYDAIAEMLGLTRGQVGTLLYRARRLVRERLSAERSPGGSP